MSEAMPNRIQLCGPMVVRIGGVDVTRELPGAQGRALFAYLVTHRTRPATREELTGALWGEWPPAHSATALRALLSKLRRALQVAGWEVLPPGELLEVILLKDSWVDTEAAAQALHDAQAAVAQNQDMRAWIASHIALNVSGRVFLAGHDNDWVLERRRALEEIQLGALEALSACSIRLGGPELDTALRAARELSRLAPYRESGYVHLMAALAARGNTAEALLVYEQLRVKLQEDLGAVPSSHVQSLHMQLLGSRAADA